MNAIWRASGDQVGSVLLLGVLVRRVGADPSAFMT